MIVRFAGLALLLNTMALHAAIETFQFDSSTQQERFRDLTERLRCPKCQNQNIADSNAPISKDLRLLVYELMRDGKTDTEIVDHLIERYGTFVTYRPPVTPVTWVLWFGPLAGLVIALLLVLLWVRRGSHVSVRDLDEAERAQIEKILAEKNFREQP